MEDDVRLIKETVTRLEQTYQEEIRTNREFRDSIVQLRGQHDRVQERHYRALEHTNGIVEALATEFRDIRGRVTQIEQRQINNLEILDQLATQIAEIRAMFR